MPYYFSKALNVTLDEAVVKVSEALKTEGFGIVNEFDVSNAFKNKLNVDFQPYKILGACNPAFAKKVLDLDDNIGVMLPCNVVLQEKGNSIFVTVIDPVVTMVAVDNPDIQEIAEEIKIKLKSALELL
jgi:uncharacterized protein (DUF302 family)